MIIAISSSRLEKSSPSSGPFQLSVSLFFMIPGFSFKRSAMDPSSVDFARDPTARSSFLSYGIRAERFKETN